MIGIYKITSPNKRVYIGQTINYNKRLVSYKNIKITTPEDLLLAEVLLK
jgi:2-C-methyl-D-erythritol 4-phosphate cytidylyltransferase